MASTFELSRREFIGSIGAAGLTVVFNRLALAAPPDSAAGGWSGPPGRARYRIEGVPKVTGQKIYARDFRSRDMPGWPVQERMAMILRADRVDRSFSSIDLSMLPPPLQPQRVVLQADLQADDITAPSAATPPAGWPAGLLATAGQRATYLGQPVAILLFKDFDSWRRAKRLLQFNPQVVVYGAGVPAPPMPAPYPPTTYLTRFADAAGEQFSQVKDGYSNPHAQPPTKVDEQARQWRERIAAEFSRPGVRSFGGEYSTQVLDPMFMEPEAGLAWFDRSGTGTMNLVLGTQATNGDLGTTLGLFAATGCPFKVSTVVLNSCYPGGGFGGRDVSAFPPLLALAAAYADGPVRIAQDRYEQFQSGLKQLDSSVRQRLAVDAAGRFVALESRLELRAGGNNNYSQWVAELAGYCGAGGYDIRKAAVDAVARPTTGVVAGSMRGFGGPQASFALECLVDEVAQALRVDAISLRERNVLHQGQHTVTGAPLSQEMKLAEICRRARAHPLWRDRSREKARRRRGSGRLYGVGFALANQAYGTGTDGVMAEVQIAADGLLMVRSNCVDMGNGSATTLALCTAGFAGSNAASVGMGEAAYFVQPLGFDPGIQGPAWDNPRWTASFSMSSSACLTAFHQAHVAEQATRVLFETALLPAAARLWGMDAAALRGRTHWRDTRLAAPGLAPLPLSALAAQVYESALPAAAMTHAVYQARWVSADYRVGSWEGTLPIDGLSTRPAGSSSWQRHDRTRTQPPPPGANLYGRSLYAPSGALAAVEIDPREGTVKVVEVQSFLDAGRVLQPDLLEGQSQGGVAMGIGYALLEDIPLLDDGGGNGRWNLDRYHVALASDVPLGRMRLAVLPSRETTGKGIAEAVLCPIAPAIANAVAFATGHRFRSLPITAQEVREALK